MPSVVHSAVEIAPVLACWVAAVAALLALAARGARSLRPGGLGRLARGEDGAAYTLSYVMVLPFYLGLIGAVVETTLMIVAKTGTVYAAFAGARTAAVRFPSDGPGGGERLTRLAAVRAFVPFASARAASRPATGPSSGGASVDADADAYLRAYAAFAEGPVAPHYLRAKYAESDRALRVRAEVVRDADPEGPDSDVVVAVTYPYPITFPFLGRVLGEAGDDGAYVYPITSTARLQEEAPRNKQRSLGISYASPRD